MTWKKFREQIADCFSTDELKVLCFDLEIDFDNFGGEGKEAKIRQFIEHIRRTDREEELIKLLEETRPKKSWSISSSNSMVHGTSPHRHLRIIVFIVLTILTILLFLYNISTVLMTSNPTLTLMSPKPTNTVTIIPSNTPNTISTINPSNTPTSTLEENLTKAPTSDPYTITISEVMANPCGNIDGTDSYWNEYIELYNYGDGTIDVNGWWVSDGEEREGNPDMIVSWELRHPDVNLGSSLTLNSTIIPPKKFAVILSPDYYLGQGAFKMPYLFPDGTILLTVADGTHLGSDDFGIEVSEFLNTITLYEGTKDLINKVVSTYGTPTLSASPQNLRNNGLDDIPFFLRDCYSAERISLLGEDSEENWREIEGGTPGYANQTQ